MKKYTYIILAALLPLTTNAAFEGIKGMLYDIADILNFLILMVAGLALLAFFWGLVKFLFRSADKVDKEQGKNLMIWGILALFVMVSVWGIIRVLQKELGLQQNTTITVPKAPGGSTNTKN